MYSVSYYRPNSDGIRTKRNFTAFASALLFFLEKLHEDRDGLRLSVFPDEGLDREVLHDSEN